MRITTRYFLYPLMGAILTLPLASAVQAKTEAERALYDRARADCNGPSYPNGSRIIINYKKGWWRCQPPKTR
jgi:hypothetical protein